MLTRAQCTAIFDLPGQSNGRYILNSFQQPGEQSGLSKASLRGEQSSKGRANELGHANTFQQRRNHINTKEMAPRAGLTTGGQLRPWQLARIRKAAQAGNSLCSKLSTFYVSGAHSGHQQGIIGCLGQETKNEGQNSPLLAPLMSFLQISQHPDTRSLTIAVSFAFSRSPFPQKRGVAKRYGGAVPATADQEGKEGHFQQLAARPCPSTVL